MSGLPATGQVSKTICFCPGPHLPSLLQKYVFGLFGLPRMICKASVHILLICRNRCVLYGFRIANVCRMLYIPMATLLFKSNLESPKGISYDCAHRCPQPHSDGTTSDHDRDCVPNSKCALVRSQTSDVATGHRSQWRHEQSSEGCHTKAQANREHASAMTATATAAAANTIAPCRCFHNLHCTSFAERPAAGRRHAVPSQLWPGSVSTFALSLALFLSLACGRCEHT
jgi:hypothetical protein